MDHSLRMLRLASAALSLSLLLCRTAPGDAASTRAKTPDEVFGDDGSEVMKGPFAGEVSSLKELVARSLPEARRWSPGARLYAAHGRGPDFARHTEANPLDGNEWQLTFGDPKKAEGSIHFLYGGGLLFQLHRCNGLKRRGSAIFYTHNVLDGSVNSFKGAPECLKTKAQWREGYSKSRPLGEDFLDSSAVQRIVESRVKRPADKQLDFALLAPTDGYGILTDLDFYALHRPFKNGVPAELRDRAVWFVSVPCLKRLFLDAKTGQVLREEGIACGPDGREPTEGLDKAVSPD